MPRPMAVHSRTGFVLAATILLMVASAVATDAAGFDPHDPVALTSSGNAGSWQRHLVATGPHHLALDYGGVVDGHPRVFIRTSPDEGGGWSAARRLSGERSRTAGLATLGGDRQLVDAAWVEGRDCFGGSRCRLRYRRSSDGGEGFDPAMTLAGGHLGSARSRAAAPRSWWPGPTGRAAPCGRASARMAGRASPRRSRWGPPASVWRSASRKGSLRSRSGRPHGLVALVPNGHKVKLRRLSGAGWRSPQTLSNEAAWPGLSLAAGDGDAMVAYRTRGGPGLAGRPITVRSGRRPSRSPGRRQPCERRQPAAPRTFGRRRIYLVAFGECANASCSKQSLHVLWTFDMGANWPKSFVAGGSPARFLGPTGLLQEDRVILSYYRVSGRKPSIDVFVQTADELAPAAHRRAHRRH